MKATKKALKEIFGDAQDGLGYLSKIIKNQKAPILFLYGPQASAMAGWLADLHGGASRLSLDGLIDGQAAKAPLAVVQTSDVTDPALRAALAARNGGHNVVVATPQVPGLVQHVHDPALLLLDAGAFSDAMRAELADVRKEVA
jgi:hypothetical protein